MTKKAGSWDGNAFALLSHALEDMHVGLVITDGKGYILHTGKSCETLYGILENSVTGEHISNLEKRDIFSPSLSLIALEKREKVSMIQPDQFGHELLVTATPIFDPEGKEILYVISYASWDSANMKELQSHYYQMQKDIVRRQMEMDRLKKEIFSVELVNESPKMKKITRFIDNTKDLDNPVLITGKIGTGKATLVRYIHSLSNRRDGPFAHISCSAFSGDILSDELFGYVTVNPKTGEEMEKIGLCEVADTGTLFLENIESMDADTQNRLVYLIKNKRYFKKNSKEAKPCDVRIIATSREDGEKLSQILDHELYYLLSVISIVLPPLRERKEDMRAFIDIFLKQMNEKYQRSLSISEEAMDLLLAYTWPGNIRELEHVVNQLAVTLEQDKIQGYHLPESISPFAPSHFAAKVDLSEYLDYYEKRLVLQAYDKCKTTVALAKYLGISQATAVRKLQKYLPKN